MGSKYSLFFKQLELFFRNKILCILYLGLLVSTIAPVVFFIVMNAEISYTFHIVTRFLFFEVMIFMIITYIFLIMDRKSKIGETLSTITHNTKAYMKSAVSVLVFLLIIFNIIILLLLLINTIITKDYVLFGMLMSRDYLYNILLPQIICFLMAVMYSQIEDFKTSSILMIISIVLLSPYMSVLEWQNKPFIPIDSVINIIRLPFSFLLQNANFSMDSLYGYQNETYKLFTFVFWGILSFGYIFKSKILGHKGRVILVGGMLSIALVGMYKPQSIYRIDNKWNGSFEDYTYYKIIEHPNIFNDIQNNEKIDNYNLDIKIENQLYVNGDFQVISSQKQDTYVFTLYRKYQIINIENDNLMEYKREGDYVYLRFKTPTEKETIKINYQGFHPTLFSNKQAVQLPGYFPWYPMAGAREVYFNNDNISEISYGLNVFNRIEEAKFNVKVHCNYPIISNLSQDVNGFLSGKADSMTLVGGNIDMFDDSETTTFTNYFPYRVNYFMTKDLYLEELSQSLDDLRTNFLRIFGDELNELGEKKVILCSEALTRTQIMGGIAEFDEYIIISEKNYIDINEYVFNKLVGREDLNPALVEVLIHTEYYSGNQDLILSNIYQMVCNEYSSFAGSDLPANRELAENYRRCKEQLEKDIEKLGQKKTMEKLGRIILGAKDENYN